MCRPLVSGARPLPSVSEIFNPTLSSVSQKKLYPTEQSCAFDIFLDPVSTYTDVLPWNEGGLAETCVNWLRRKPQQEAKSLFKSD